MAMRILIASCKPKYLRTLAIIPSWLIRDLSNSGGPKKFKSFKTLFTVGS